MSYSDCFPRVNKDFLKPDVKSRDEPFTSCSSSDTVRDGSVAGLIMMQPSRFAFSRLSHFVPLTVWLHPTEHTVCLIYPPTYYKQMWRRLGSNVHGRGSYNNPWLVFFDDVSIHFNYGFFEMSSQTWCPLSPDCIWIECLCKSYLLETKFWN